MAVLHARTGEVRIGKGRDGVVWLLKIVGYVNDTYPECHYDVLTNIGNRLDQEHAVSRFESLAQYEAFQTKLLTDEKYQALVQEMWDAQLFTAWSDRLYQVLP